MKKKFITFAVLCFSFSTLTASNASEHGSGFDTKPIHETLIAANEPDQNQESEKRAAEEKARQEKIETEKRAAEDRERQQKAEAEQRASEEREKREKAENDRRSAEEERLRKEKIESDQRQQETNRQQQLQETEKKAYEDRIRQEKIDSDRREQEMRRQQLQQEAERKAYEERLRQEKIDAVHQQKEMLLRQQQIEAEKKAQEAAIEKEREEARKQAEELKKQQQRLESERREENRRNQMREQELRRQRERLEEERRRREHSSHRHDHYDRDHHSHGSGYDSGTTIIYKEENTYYSDPYPSTDDRQYPQGNAYPGYQTPSSATPPAREDVRTAKSIIKEILENEALEPDMDISTANSDFCRGFMKSLRDNDGQIIFIDPVVATDDASDPELARSFPCYKKAGISEKSLQKSISLAGERKLRLYRLKKLNNPKKSEYDYILYGEPLEATERADLFPGYSRIDSSTCRVKRELIVKSEDSDTGSFSTIISYKKQYYIFDVSDSTTPNDTDPRHIIRLHKYSDKKGVFEQDPYAYWRKSEPIN